MTMRTRLLTAPRRVEEYEVHSGAGSLLCESTSIATTIDAVRTALAAGIKGVHVHELTRIDGRAFLKENKR